MQERVVITGTSVITPVGSSVEEVFTAWREGRSNFVTFDDGANSTIRFCGKSPSVDLTVLHDRKVQKVLTRRDVIGLVALMRAAKDAGFPNEGYDPERLGMYVGSSSTQIGDMRPYLQLIQKSCDATSFDARLFGAGLMNDVNPMVMMQSLMNNVLCYGCIALDFRGVNATFVDFQSAGLRSVGEAFHSIRSGRADAVMAGGVAVMPETYHATEAVAMGYLRSSAADELSCKIVPYRKDGQGAILSDGAAFVMLESEGKARKRGAKILGYIDGFAQVSEGGFTYMQHSRVLEVSGLLKNANHRNSEEIYVIGTGNGSALEDAREHESLSEWSKDNTKVRLTSCKGATGELSEASGVLSLCLAVHALQSKVLPGVESYESVMADQSQEVVASQECHLKHNQMTVLSRSFNGVACAIHVSGT